MPHFLTNEGDCLRFPRVIDREADGGRGGTEGPNLQVIISRRRSSSACTRTSGDRRTRTEGQRRPKTTNFPFSSRGATADDASCYATITNDGDVVHHHEAHVRTSDKDAGETLNISARNLGQKSMRRASMDRSCSC